MKIFLVSTIIFLAIFDFKYWTKPESTATMCVQPLYLGSCTYLSQTYQTKPINVQ
jgi:hypothetical protein